MSEEQTQQTEQTAEAQSNGVDLTVQDLAALKQIIDVASQRGAFKPNEMTVVGTTYSKLEAFLNAVQAQQSAEAEQGA
jgi:translation initiation factor IF-2